jgi:hypothetical protein
MTRSITVFRVAKFSLDIFSEVDNPTHTLGDLDLRVKTLDNNVSNPTPLWPILPVIRIARSG